MNIKGLLTSLRAISGEALSATEKDSFADLELLHELLALSQGAAWSFCLKRFPPGSLEAVMTHETAWAWHNFLSKIERIDGSLDPEIPLLLATGANPKTQYILLNGAICSTNGQFVSTISRVEISLKAKAIRQKVTAILSTISSQVSTVKKSRWFRLPKRSNDSAR